MSKGSVSLIDGHIDGSIDDIKCPCSLRKHMESEDCEKMECDKCCPLAQEGDEI